MEEGNRRRAPQHDQPGRGTRRDEGDRPVVLSVRWQEPFFGVSGGTVRILTAGRDEARTLFARPGLDDDVAHPAPALFNIPLCPLIAGFPQEAPVQE